MVFATCILEASKKAARKYLRPIFIDSLRLTVKGGSGGTGTPRYGGIGGQGGDVYFVARENLTLETLKAKLAKKRLNATSGADSTPRGIIGARGDDVSLEVPVGLTIKTSDGALLGELNKDGDQLLVAKGGLGGCPETQYFGTKGQSHTLILDLKLIADVGLVGFPNAGKSTLLATISNAKPKIADYPFTTVKPQVATIRYKDHREITMADLPGLMEGAHNNTGKGFKFLKHIERTKILLFVVDIEGFQYSVNHVRRSCLETIVLLNKELELYKPDLIDKPAILLLNKMDKPNADKIYSDVKPMLTNLSEFLSEFEDEIRPEKVLQFEEILTASLISKNPDEINRIKEMVRTVIDETEKRKQSRHNETPADEQLKQKLLKFNEKITPTLV